jgi:spermidine synthase
MIALGGAVGGIFVGLVAPRLFRDYWELPAGLMLCAFLAVVTSCRQTRYRLLGPALAAPVLGLLAWTISTTGGFVKPARLVVRDFYGVLRISDVDVGTMAARRMLTHGVINHGEQLLDATLRREPTTYYGRGSGVGLAILHTRGDGPQRVGVIGLGAGTLASYGRPGDSYRIYELDPQILHLARTEFTFLADCRAHADVILGDARLSLEREPPQEFDVLAVDAFSGDAVPVHLLTTEALALYFRHLRPNGILALHVSSKYLDLASVGVQAARDLGKRAFVVTEAPTNSPFLLTSNWVLVGNSPAALDPPELSRAADPEKALRHIRAWTDQYSNLLRVLR